jgi:hypothetical protein
LPHTESGLLLLPSPPQPAMASPTTATSVAHAEYTPVQGYFIV